MDISSVEASSLSHPVRVSLHASSVSLVLILSLGLFATLTVGVIPATHAETLASWDSATAFPLANVSTSCAAYGGYIYCIGGNQVYYAAISSSGIGDWSSTTSYPVGTQTSVAPVCAASGGYIYCVGGDDGSPTTLRYSVYYASLSASGVGTWIQTTNTTGASNSQSCFISGSYLYCVGGDYGIGTMTTRNVVYAPISSAGVGTWTNTTLYPVPIYDENCVASGAYVYCIGGAQDVGGYSWTSATYFAPISPSGGLGAWTSTTVYPNGVSPTPCETSGGYVYCMSGFNYPQGVNNDAVYYAPMSSAGIGAWSNELIAIS
jgi:hypothetical protein